MVAIGQFIGPRRVAIFAYPLVPDPTFASRVVGFLLADAIVDNPNALSFDRTVSRSHRRTVRWARSPIEREIADNKIRDPDEIRIDGVLSANPAGGLLPFMNVASSLVRRDIEAMNKLRSIAEAGPVVIVTPERSYPSMGIEVLDERHGSGDKIDVSLRARAVRILDPLAVSGAFDLTTIIAGAFAAESVGSQGTVTVPDPGGFG
jgi:hypothetical protein